MIRFLLVGLHLLVLTSTNGTVSPYAIETKVQEDLESLLARVMTREDFVVQVRAEVVTDVKRRLIEGETVESETPASQIPPELMPGFVAELDPKLPQLPPKKSTQRYQSVETPRLASVRVHVSFNGSLPASAIKQGRRIVYDYMMANYPSQTKLKFSAYPMIKPTKQGEPPLPVLTPQNRSEPTLEEQWQKWLPWGVLALVLLAWLFTSMRKKTQQENSGQTPWNGPLMYPPFYPSPMPAYAGNAGALSPGAVPEAKAEKKQEKEETPNPKRSMFLSQAIGNAMAFRRYYEKLSTDHQGELETVLEGPAFDSFMESLDLKREEKDATLSEEEIGEKTNFHIDQFEEFVKASRWQEMQFFGFLQHLSNDQLLSLISFETDTNVCLMLRFMKPEQSAFILDNLPHEKRLSVISHLNTIHNMPLGEISSIEKKVRNSLQRLPPAMLGPGQQEIDFWGNVLSEASRSSEIIQELEQTKSEIFPHLKKFKFSLEDAASLSDEVLSRAVSESDNEELCLALSTCPENVQEIILDALSERRREVIQDQLPGYRAADPLRAKKARTNLTRRIREAVSDD